MIIQWWNHLGLWSGKVQKQTMSVEMYYPVSLVYSILSALQHFLIWNKIKWNPWVIKSLLSLGSRSHPLFSLMLFSKLKANHTSYCTEKYLWDINLVFDFHFDSSRLVRNPSTTALQARAGVPLHFPGNETDWYYWSKRQWLIYMFPIVWEDPIPNCFQSRFN